MSVETVSSASIDARLGAVWDLHVAVRDIDGCLVDDPAVITVTPPDGTPATPDVETDGTGQYRAVYVLAEPGRYVARAVTAENGAADFAAFVTEPTPAGGMPDLAEVLNYLLWETDTDTDEAAFALAAESAAQRGKCRVDAIYPDDLRNALFRRIARNLAMKGIPLAVLRGNAEDGTLVVPGNDPEVRRLEAPYRRLPMG